MEMIVITNVFHLQFQNVTYPLFSVYKIVNGIIYKITVRQY